MKERAILTPGKIVEITAVSAIVKAGGAPAGARAGWSRFADYARVHGFSMDHTDETAARQRKTDLYTVDGERINPGRGERIFDAVVKAPVIGLEHALFEYIPVSIKAGDSRDISVDIPALRAWVESGAPLWVYCLQGEAEAVHYRQGIVEPAKNITMRRINLTEVINSQEADAWSVEGPKRYAFLRIMKVNGYSYERFRVNWKSVPASLWLDKDYIEFNPAAPLPLFAFGSFALPVGVRVPLF